MVQDAVIINLKNRSRGNNAPDMDTIFHPDSSYGIIYANTNGYQTNDQQDGGCLIKSIKQVFLKDINKYNNNKSLHELIFDIRRLTKKYATEPIYINKKSSEIYKEFKKYNILHQLPTIHVTYLPILYQLV